MATIRAYGETARFTKENTYYMDLENRAYFLTATNQRWLSVRLDFLGACLVFAVAIMAANGGGGLFDLYDHNRPDFWHGMCSDL
jgi:ATP-binding cassette subfamily C (CFTR/MRP) protein 1